MNWQLLLRRGWPILTALLSILLVSGCGDDDPAVPKPNPEISLSLECDGGLIDLTVRNAGATMPDPSLFIAAFTDGQSDTLLVSLDADESMTCQLSNIHGGVTVTNDEWDLEATADDCLANYFDSLLTSVNLSELVPSPLAQTTFLACTYTIYLSNFAYADPTFELIRTDDGLTLKYVCSDVTGDISAPSPSWLCPDITGDIAISSIVVEIRVDIGDGDDPTVTLGEGVATINGFHVNVDGTFGFIVEVIAGWLQNYFTDAMENALALAISNQVGGTDLSSLVIVSSRCAE